MTQGSSVVSFGYDSADRRTSLTLPNNVLVSYSYDNNSRVSGISYTLGTNTLGTLVYAYDQLGQRTQISGSFARTSLPQPVVSASYDAANELTTWNGIVLSYDLNGNTLSGGTHSLTWNARNQVASINGINLQYDAFGRRVQSLAGTAFLYDGTNAVQELSGTTVNANLLSGDIDEVFSRTDSSGAFTPLKDALGSTIALTNSSGSVQTSYTYDPYGNTSVTGTSNANEFQYTGRENDGNGLYYYRARYYDPALGRFISEDPIGFLGGNNVYTYVGDTPIDLKDPLGLAPNSGCKPPNCDKYKQRHRWDLYFICTWFPNNKKSNCVRKCLQDLFGGDGYLGTYALDGLGASFGPGSDAITGLSKLYGPATHYYCFHECGYGPF